MRSIIYLCITILIFSCSNKEPTENEICECMNHYSINHTESQLKLTKACLEGIGVKIDYFDPVNAEYIHNMKEDGGNICPPESRKFWHFLMTMNEKNLNND